MRRVVCCDRGFFVWCDIGLLPGKKLTIYKNRPGRDIFFSLIIDSHSLGLPSEENLQLVDMDKVFWHDIMEERITCVLIHNFHSYFLVRLVISQFPEIQVCTYVTSHAESCFLHNGSIFFSDAKFAPLFDLPISNPPSFLHLNQRMDASFIFEIEGFVLVFESGYLTVSVDEVQLCKRAFETQVVSICGYRVSNSSLFISILLVTNATLMLLVGIDESIVAVDISGCESMTVVSQSSGDFLGLGYDQILVVSPENNFYVLGSAEIIKAFSPVEGHLKEIKSDFRNETPMKSVVARILHEQYITGNSELEDQKNIVKIKEDTIRLFKHQLALESSVYDETKYFETVSVAKSEFCNSGEEFRYFEDVTLSIEKAEYSAESSMIFLSVELRNKSTRSLSDVTLYLSSQTYAITAQHTPIHKLEGNAVTRVYVAGRLHKQNENDQVVYLLVNHLFCSKIVSRFSLDILKQGSAIRISERELDDRINKHFGTPFHRTIHIETNEPKSLVTDLQQKCFLTSVSISRISAGSYELYMEAKSTSHLEEVTKYINSVKPLDMVITEKTGIHQELYKKCLQQLAAELVSIESSKPIQEVLQEQIKSDDLMIEVII